MISKHGNGRRRRERTTRRTNVGGRCDNGILDGIAAGGSGSDDSRQRTDTVASVGRYSALDSMETVGLKGPFIRGTLITSIYESARGGLLCL